MLSENRGSRSAVGWSAQDVAVGPIKAPLVCSFFHRRNSLAPPRDRGQDLLCVSEILEVCRALAAHAGTLQCDCLPGIGNLLVKAMSRVEWNEGTGR